MRDNDFTVGVVTGGLLVITNLFVLSRIIQKGFSAKDDEVGARVSPSFLIGIILKTSGLFGGVILAIVYFKIDSFGFLLGVSVLFISLAVWYLFSQFLSK